MNYYLGGLAELVSRPTDLTFSFFQYWFTGATGLGKGMEIVSLPYVKTDQPILKMHDGQMVVDLLVEEKTLYDGTVFSYDIQKNLAAEPKLKINWNKIANPTKYGGTASVLVSQINWLVNPGKITAVARRMVESIPKQKKLESIVEADEFLTDFVWPAVVAIGVWAEYFHRVVESEIDKSSPLWSEIDGKISEGDWFFDSLSDQEKVRNGEISQQKYLQLYGLRADQDYELSCPRWEEIPSQLKKRINSQKFPTRPSRETASASEFNSHVKTLVELQKMRSEVRRMALEPFNRLRQLIIKKVGTGQISNFTREELIFGRTRKAIEQTFSEGTNRREGENRTGRGTAVSLGKIVGLTHHFKSSSENVKPGLIGIFPNASPEFTVQFPQCAGLIFLRGGQTSHGAIVAREFKIPAIIDERAGLIPEGVNLSLDGASGEWEVV